MSLNRKYETEEETKFRLINPSLQRAGWKGNLIMMEYSLRSDYYKIVPEENRTIKIPVPKRSRPDYLLCHTVHCPIAVIEAKRGAKEPSEGLDQAVSYAKILDLPFAYSTNGQEFVERNMKTCQERRFPMEDFPGPEKLWDMCCEAREIKNEDREKLGSARYRTSDDGKIPRYYQMVAINRTVNAIVAEHKKRALLVMATGTGKTYTAFQIVWRLRKAGVVHNVLYLADRNQLVDQTLNGDFQPFHKIQTKIRNGEIDQNYEIYFGLYQQLKGHETEGGDGSSSFADNFRQVPPNYFDLIIVDECHRGSAREESSWREILEYFSDAIQIGMTATPSSKEGADNADYFGEPLYTYSLKQGIADGFLAPFQVVNVQLDKDETGWEPEEGEKDENGVEIPKKTYTRDDFDRSLILRERTEVVAKEITNQLHRLGRMSKTIVFCATQNHALRMRDALRAMNVDMMQKDSNYVVRMTGDDEEGKALYDAFTSATEDFPVVVTTSKLLTTGADTKCVKLIVLDSPIRSMTEFKQIIGRGTRLREDAEKTFFTILDFRNVTELFKDPAWDGDPKDNEEPRSGGSGGGAGGAASGSQGGNEQKPKPNPGTHTYIVKGVPVEVTGSRVSYLGEDGKPVVVKFKDYTRRNILEAFGSEADFLEVWNGPEEKKQIVETLAKHGVLLEELRREMGNPDCDEFDLILTIAFGGAPLNRAARASRVARTKFLDKYQGIAKEVLSKLLDIYAHEGVFEIDNIAVLRSEEFSDMGGMSKIVKAFGGKKPYLDAVKSLEKEIYKPIHSEAVNNVEASL